jgi:putative nucleotidyltransferase with HDIG domain
MTPTTDRLSRYEDVVQRLSGALRAAQLYSAAHPTVTDLSSALHAGLTALHQTEPSVIVGFVGGELIAADRPLLRASAVRREFTGEMQALGINRIVFDRGVTLDEVFEFVQAITKKMLALRAAGGQAPDPSAADVNVVALPHIRAGRIPIEEASGNWGSGALTVHKVYGSSVDSARTVWESARTEGQPDMPTARQTVEHLAGAAEATGGLMIGLTGMLDYDEYTFTHMVNVAILTMAQARSLGIEGDRLREMGLAALLHDIGKVRTPPAILNKPAVLTPREFDVMKRHPIDGAAILRGTPEMPRLAAIVAFEHHLRQDRTGYPVGLSRPDLNLGTVLCCIADVYDAMRSKRAYQASQPTDRILEVMRRNDGKQFDQDLVRRFISLMGVFPPATVVRLSTGEVAIVVENDGDEPDRPTVKIIADRDGGRLAEPQLRVLWDEPRDDDGDGVTVVAALDPTHYSFDVISLLAPS